MPREARPELGDWIAARLAQGGPCPPDADWAARLLGDCPGGLIPSLDELLTSWFRDLLVEVEALPGSVDWPAIHERFMEIRRRSQHRRRVPKKEQS